MEWYRPQALEDKCERGFNRTSTSNMETSSYFNTSQDVQTSTTVMVPHSSNNYSDKITSTFAPKTSKLSTKFLTSRGFHV